MSGPFSCAAVNLQQTELRTVIISDQDERIRPLCGLPVPVASFTVKLFLRAQKKGKHQETNQTQNLFTMMTTWDLNCSV